MTYDYDNSSQDNTRGVALHIFCDRPEITLLVIQITPIAYYLHGAMY